MVFEHSIVNMFLFPTALMMGGDFSIVDYFMWNEIPTVLGNLVGGLTFTGLTLYATHIRTQPERKRQARSLMPAARRGRGRRGGPQRTGPLPASGPTAGDLARPLFDGRGQVREPGLPRRARARGRRSRDQGHCARAGRRDQHQPARRRRGRDRGQELPDRLLLHLGRVVGADRGRAGDRRDQLLDARAESPRRPRADDEDRERGADLHLQRAGAQVARGAPVPCRRRAHRADRAAGSSR